MAMAKVRKVAKKSPKAQTASKGKAVKKTSKTVKKSSASHTGKSKRLLSDLQIAKLQKLYKSGKYSAQHLCDEFGISMATLFNYLKIKV